MRHPPSILFAGGGTGGHVYPAISIADEVRHMVPDAGLYFAGTRDRMEWEVVSAAGFEIYPISISGFHRGQPIRNLALPFKIAKALRESFKLVKTVRPDVAVGTGGYVSGPVLLAASLKGVPIVIQEQNAYAGVTNRLLGRRAARIHVAFLEAKDHLPAEKCVFSGNPTRRALLVADRIQARDWYDVPQRAFVLVILGGSLGSRAINEALVRNVEALLDDDLMFVIWQSGSRYHEEMKRRTPEHPRLRLLEYIDRMDVTYAAADLVLSRSGAITCSELMVTGTPSILVPSPNVAEDHQTHNAQSMEKSGAAVLLPEAEIQARLVAEIRSLRAEPRRLSEMADAARQFARPEAAKNIASDILRLIGVDPPEEKERTAAGDYN